MKQNKNQELYTSLTLYFALELHNKADEPIINMQLEQKKHRDDLLLELSKILLSYTIIDSALSLTLGDNSKLYSKLGNIIENTIKKELKNEAHIIEEILSNTCLEKLNTDNYIFSLGSNSKLTKMSDKILDKIINEKIDGEIWSNRIWKNKTKLGEDLKLYIKQFLDGKINVNDIKKVIKNEYGSNAYQTERLLRTEIEKIQTASNDYWAKDKGIKQQLFVATLDNKTSKICQNFDGTVWDIDDVDKPIPPSKTHPNCRSCLVNLVSSDWRPSKRMDNIQKENIDWQTYKEWKKKQES